MRKMPFVFDPPLISSPSSQPDANLTADCRLKLRTNGVQKQLVVTIPSFAEHPELGSKTIYDYRNVFVRPCDNFYEFVCGGYRASRQNNQSEGDIYSQLKKFNKERIRDILDSDTYPAEPEFVKKVKTFYRSCLNRDKQASQNLQLLLERLDDWGGWPIATQKWLQDKFDWMKLLLHLTKTTTMNPLFVIEVGRDNRNASQLRLTIDQTDDEDMDCSHHEERDSEESLKDSIVSLALHIAKATNQNISDKRIKTEAERIIRFKALLCRIRQTYTYRLYVSNYYIKTVKQLQNLTDSVLPINKYAQIKWLQLLNGFLEESTMKIDENEEVVMRDYKFFSELVYLIDNTSQRTLANYMLWQHIRWMEAEKWLEHLEDDFSDEQNDMETDTKEKRWETCVEKTEGHFPHVIGYLYVEMYSTQVIKQRIENFTQNIHKSFLEDLRHNEWMDTKTRSSAVEKAHHIKYLIGYPDWYSTTEFNKEYQKYPLGDNYITNMEHIRKIEHQSNLDLIDGTERDMDSWSSITEPNAYNDFKTSSIEINAAYYEAPLYEYGRPEALNYGGLGFTIGHEITHSFDDLGGQYDGLGILRNWWTNDSLRKFKAKTQCIEEIYNDYPTTDLENKEAWKLDGSGTITENIADIGGLEIALSAYRRYLRQHGPEKKLPGLTQYTSEQLFFIGYGLRFCEAADSDLIAQIILTDRHTPLIYRSLITVSNSEDFSDVWKCKEGDKMNAPKKCSFW